ncbi:hypothetical protein ILYODFUR_023491, partial [Ilyodon furcidens]
GWPCGEIHGGVQRGWEAHQVKIQIHWGTGTVPSWGGSGWRFCLDRVEPSFVLAPSRDGHGGRWGLGSEQGVGVWARVIRVWVVAAQIWTGAMLSPWIDGATSWVRGVVTPQGYWYLDLGV